MVSLTHRTNVMALKPLELAYRAVAGVRRRLYRAGILHSRRLPRPVISIGNIAFGGSGKTPLVIAVAAELIARRYRVAILSRGYGRAGEDQAAVVERPDTERYGDEPVLIARAVPEAHVVVGANRWKAGMWYLQRHDCDLFLLDDGFQHLRLERDLDIVIDSPRASWLRESRAALSDADIILVRDHSLRIEPTAVVVNGAERPVARLQGASAFLFSGLADNRQFFETCRNLGMKIIGQRGFRDHHRYSELDLETLRAEAARRGAELLVTSEKDFVKINDPAIAYLRIVARVVDRGAFIDRIIATIRSRTSP